MEMRFWPEILLPCRFSKMGEENQSESQNSFPGHWHNELA
jgi:hypothetical protein